MMIFRLILNNRTREYTFCFIEQQKELAKPFSAKHWAMKDHTSSRWKQKTSYCYNILDIQDT